jgi:hypothetical protein
MKGLCYKLETFEPGYSPINPPHIRVSSDYNKQPSAPRCFNCEFLRDVNLDFYCSKFMVKVKVYQVCDEWKADKKEQLVTSSSRLLQVHEPVGEKTTEGREPLILIPAKKE